MSSVQQYALGAHADRTLVISVADHMYRMGMLCMLVPGVAGDSAKGYPKLDIGRCVQMALVHDLAEAQ